MFPLIPCKPPASPSSLPDLAEFPSALGRRLMIISRRVCLPNLRFSQSSQKISPIKTTLDYRRRLSSSCNGHLSSVQWPSRFPLSVASCAPPRRLSWPQKTIGAGSCDKSLWSTSFAPRIIEVDHVSYHILAVYISTRTGHGPIYWEHKSLLAIGDVQIQHDERVIGRTPY